MGEVKFNVLLPLIKAFATKDEGRAQSNIITIVASKLENNPKCWHFLHKWENVSSMKAVQIHLISLKDMFKFSNK